MPYLLKNSDKNNELYEYFNGKSILITGATGLVGSNILSFFDSIISYGVSLSLFSTS